jgi:predicted Rossmann fold nucleotide-binding protein DprA/Smf involved in DNA uptake
VDEIVAIVGSRSWVDYEMVRDYVYSLDETDTVVSGGAKGPDQWASGVDTLTCDICREKIRQM